MKIQPSGPLGPVVAGRGSERGVGPAAAERVTGAIARPASRSLRRDIGPIGLLFTSVGSIIGSGWLFGALRATVVAGPAAILSWVIGGLAMVLLALIHAELGGMYPVAGGSARFPQYAFGTMIGFVSGWFAFLGTVATAPIEAEATLQYASIYMKGLTTLAPDGTPVLTGTGFVMATILMLVFSIINVMGVRWLSEVNSAAVWWKIAIPVLTVIVLLLASFHPDNFTAGGGFLPYGWKGVFVAMAGGGVIFSFLGFEQAIQLGAESRNPQRNIPLAVIGSMILGVILYVALQVTFITAMDPGAVGSKGWNLAFTGTGATYGPFAGLTVALGLGWLAFLIYADAVISPGGTGLLYVGTSSRLLFALTRDGYVPSLFAQLSSRCVPFYAIAFSFLCGILLFLPFPGWYKLVGFVSSATVIAYAMAPLALGALRRQEPDRDRPFRLPCASVLAPLGFTVANELILFSSWAVVQKLVLAIAIGFVLLAIHSATSSADKRPVFDWASARWLWPYLVGVTLISYLGSFDIAPKDSPSLGILPFGWDILAMATFSLAIYFLAVRARLSDERARQYVGDLGDAVAETEAAPWPLPAQTSPAPAHTFESEVGRSGQPLG